MSVVANCQTTSTSSPTTVSMDFNRNWVDDLKVTNGMKGKINRAILCKQSLDKRNVNYGTARANLTVAAGYSMLLGDIGDNFNLVLSNVNAFDNIYAAAVQEVK
eukprot:399220_1